MVKVIIEGPDGAGKTILAEYMVQSWGPRAFILKSPAGKQATWDPVFDNWVNDAPYNPQRITIFDRVPEISEAVYGPIFRGGLRGIPGHNRFICEWDKWAHRATGPVIVVFCLHREGDLMTEDAHTTPDGHAVNPHLCQVQLEYEGLARIFQASGIPTIFYHRPRIQEGLVTFEMGRVVEDIEAIVGEDYPEVFSGIGEE